jgi:hypothetical protein
MEDEIIRLLDLRNKKATELGKWREYEPQHRALLSELMRITHSVQEIIEAEATRQVKEDYKEFKRVIGRDPYIDHCWRPGCRTTLFEPTRAHCITCRWMLCDCESCGCGYIGPTIGRRRL